MSLNSMIFAGISFFITISILFSQNHNFKNQETLSIVETNKPEIEQTTRTSTNKNTVAQIKTTSVTPNVSILIKSTVLSTPSPSSSELASLQVTVSPTTTQTQLINPTISLEPSITIISTNTPITTPTITRQAMNSNHIFYTSSHWKSKYYYCDTDPEWQNLSEKYKKQFNSIDLLLAEFPSRILHEPCE